jgi:hypothetical protein
MSVTKTFSEGWYFYWCDVREVSAGVFSCAITFTSDRNNGPLKTTKINMDGAFASAELAMGSGERYGRSLIRKHGDIVHYLATHALTE